MAMQVPDVRLASGRRIDLDFDVSVEFSVAKVFWHIGKALDLPTECLELIHGAGYEPNNWNDMCVGVTTVIIRSDTLQQFLCDACGVQPVVSILEALDLNMPSRDLEALPAGFSRLTALHTSVAR